MYEKYPITIEMVIRYSLYLGIFLCLLSFVISLLKKNKLRESILLAAKVGIISIILLIFFGISCRKGIHQIDYHSMVHDKSVQYFLLIRNDTTDVHIKETLKEFINGNQPQTAKDTLKIKCQSTSHLFLSVLKDLSDYCDLGSQIDSFKLSSKSHELYNILANKLDEKQISDSIVIPFIMEMNNKKGEIYFQIKLAKSFADTSVLNKIQNGINSKIEKIEKTYTEMFKDEL